MRGVSNPGLCPQKSGHIIPTHPVTEIPALWQIGKARPVCHGGALRLHRSGASEGRPSCLSSDPLVPASRCFRNGEKGKGTKEKRRQRILIAYGFSVFFCLKDWRGYSKQTCRWDCGFQLGLGLCIFRGEGTSSGVQQSRVSGTAAGRTLRPQRVDVTRDRAGAEGPRLTGCPPREGGVRRRSSVPRFRVLHGRVRGQHSRSGTRTVVSECSDGAESRCRAPEAGAWLCEESVPKAERPHRGLRPPQPHFCGDPSGDLRPRASAVLLEGMEGLGWLPGLRPSPHTLPTLDPSSWD